MNASSASTTVQLQSSNSTLQANFKQSVTIINVSFKDEVLMGQLTRSVSVTSGHSATYTVYGVEITEREDDRGNYDSWEEITPLQSHRDLQHHDWIVMTDITVRCLRA